ncbi:DUF4381 domain-containing protein [Pseudomaricurvus sp.]|uniref:DUF4381 domain-containing protein n=1 Tax=Pseudomaricurvus sp. TaxID=2004510 RepID=UPI003F6C5C0D
MPTLTPPSSAPVQSQPDPLAGLRDIHTPAEISSFPIAPGWWILAALVLASLIVGWLILQRKRQQQLYRKEALALLEQAVDNSSNDDSQRLQNINNLLKRVALAAYPSASVASIHGQEWSDFLLRSAPNVPQPSELPDILSSGLYASPSQQSQHADTFYQYARNWIKQHVKASKLPQQTEAAHAAP